MKSVHRLIVCCLAILMLAPPLPAQQTSAPAAVKTPLAFGLQDGTPVKLRINRTVSSGDARVNDTVDFEVLEEVQVNGIAVIPKGGIAWATVTQAQAKRRMGRGGKLDMNIDSARLLSGEKVALRAVKEGVGGGHVGGMTGAIVATSIIFFPAAPLFLFIKGKDITIPKGTEITAYINGDAPLDLAKFERLPMSVTALTAVPTEADITQQSIPATGLDASSVALKSTPDGADITIDGKYVGSTPSTVMLTPGDHNLSIQKPSYKVWQRTILVSAGGNATVHATLEHNE